MRELKNERKVMIKLPITFYGYYGYMVNDDLYSQGDYYTNRKCM